MEENKQIVVWTLPSCPGCMATKRALTKRGVEFEERDATQLSEELKTQLKNQLGANLTAPIVQTPDGEFWAGYRPDKIDKIAPKNSSPKSANSSPFNHPAIASKPTATVPSL